MKKMMAFMAVAAALLTAVSCENSRKFNPGKPFEAAGSAFATLQEAVDALSAQTEYDKLRTITLRADAKGDGAVVSSEANLFFELDLGVYKYELKPGSSIRLEVGAGMYVSGSGGLIHSSGESFAIDSEGDFVYFTQNASLLADKAIRAAGGGVVVADSFSGRISGDIELDRCYMEVFSAGKGIEIPQLKVTGTGRCDAALSAQIIGPAEAVTSISSISSNLQYPVWADDAASVRMPQGASVHVHSFGEVVNHNATCRMEEYGTRTCEVCGFEKAEFAVGTSDLGPCDPADLIHVEAVAAQPPHTGCVEHWLCPYCNRVYSDPEGLNPIQGGAGLVPANFSFDAELLHGCDDDFNWQSVEEVTKSATALAIAGIVIGLASTALADSHSTVESGNMEARLNEKLSAISSKIDDLKTSIDGISDQLDRLETKLSGISGQVDRIVEMMTEYIQDYETEKFKKVAVDYNTRRSLMVKVGKEADEVLRQFLKYRKDYLQSQAPADSVNLMKTLAYWQDQTARYRMLDAIDIIDDFTQDASLNSYIDYVYDYASYVYPWEHESYDFIFQNVAEFMTYMTQAYLMSTYCYIYDERLTPDMKKYKCQQLYDSFAKVDKHMAALQKTFRDRDAKYRRCNLSSLVAGVHATTYERQAFYFDKEFQNWLQNNRDRSFSSEAAEKTCSEMASYIFHYDHDHFMDSNQVDLILKYQNTRNYYPMLKIIEETLGFKPGREVKNYVYFCPTETFKYRGGMFPDCGMFSWYSGIASDNDWLALNTAFAPNTRYVRDYFEDNGYMPSMSHVSKYTEKFQVECNIRKSDGIITNLGEANPRVDAFFAIRVADYDQGFKKELRSNLGN